MANNLIKFTAAAAGLAGAGAAVVLARKLTQGQTEGSGTPASDYRNTCLLYTS